LFHTGGFLLSAAHSMARGYKGATPMKQSVLKTGQLAVLRPERLAAIIT